MSDILTIRPAADCRWDLAAFGEVMLRFDPGFGRVRNARSFQVWEGGGEYNVARAMRKTWGKRATVATALPVNDLGWLVEDFICQGGVDTSHLIWRPFDGIGRDDDYYTAGFGAKYLINRNFALSGGYAYRTRNSSAASSDFDENVVFLRLSSHI